jgi:hypothetical protein
LLDLRAAVSAVHAPFAEVLAVVGQDPVGVLADSRSRPRDHGVSIESSVIVRTNPDRASARKLLEGHFLDRSGAPAAGEAPIVHHIAVADVDAVMHVASARRDDMRCEAKRGAARHESLLALCRVAADGRGRFVLA